MPTTLRPTGLVLALTLAACGARQPVPAPEAPPAPPPARAVRPPPTPPTVRLPSQTRPTGYTAELTLDPTQPTFQGVIDIDLEMKAPTDALWLHGHHLKVKEARLTVDGQPVAVTATPPSGDFLGFVPERTLAPGAAHLRLVYEGEQSEKETAGAFRVQSHEDGAWYTYTQLEPLGARRVFPCFDEPGFKVPWQLTLHVPAGNVAVSNTPLQGEPPQATQGLTTWRFARTQPLPSYLIALGVGPFDFLDAAPSGEKAVRTRIITPRGHARDAAYAAKVTPEILGHLEHYFAIPYPYEKLDILAVPQLGGAMENAGLVTFNSELILMRPGEEDVERQRAFYHTQMHELAHQWLGDLVTMAWWDDLWLNESFASWADEHVTEKVQPTWGAALDRVSGRSNALSSDSLVSARKIRQPIESDDDILNAFDGITYGKGAAVLAMTERWLGEDVFQRGLRRHLRAHAHGNATAQDFLQALSAEAGQDVSGVLGSFVDQGGAPIVSARLECAAGKPPVLQLAQSRFLPLGSSGDSKRTWRVPLCVRYGSGKTAARTCTVLEGESAELALTGAKGCPTWWMPNAEGAGYFRTALDAQALGQLLSPRASPLSLAERVSLLGDVQALVRAGKMPAADAMSLLPTLAGEKDRQVFEASLELLRVFPNNLLSEARQADRKRMMRELYGARAQALGFTPRPHEDDDTRLLRPVLLSLAGSDGDEPKLVAEARALTERWLTDPKAISPELVDTTLNIAASHGDAALHARLLAALRAEKERKRRDDLMGALGGFLAPELVRENFALVLDPTMDLRDTFFLFMRAAWDMRTRDQAFAFLRENYDALASRLPEERVSGLMSAAGSYCDPVHRQEVAAFFSPRLEKIPGGPRVFAQVLERMDLCIAYKQAQGASIETFLAQGSQKKGTPAGR